MELNLSFFTVFSFALLSATFLLLAFILILLIRIFAGKSLTNPEYPPVYGTVYGQVFYLNNLYDHLTEISKKHGTFRQLAAGYSEIFTTDPRNIEHISKTKFGDYSLGNQNREVTWDVIGDGIFAADGEKWRQQRKLASFEFSTRVLRDFSCSVFRNNAVKVLQIVSEYSRLRCHFDIQDLFMRYTLDSILKIGFGVELNCTDSSNKEGNLIMKTIDDLNSLLAYRYIDPFWKLKKLLNIGSEAAIKKNLNIINTMVYGVIKHKRNLLRQQTINDKEDILSRFLLESEKDPENMNDKYLRDIVLSFMVAGRDTTASAASWFFYMLCKNPLVQEKVAEEVRNIIGIEEDEDQGIDINTFMQNLTYSALEKMHYLHATLSETLRLYPTIPVNGRIAEIDDILPDGYKVKKGDFVWYLPYSMGRMTCLWGEDAEDFKPERWLKDGIFQPESPFKFSTFYAGSRICLGKEFAYRQMKIISATLLHFFRFKLADETRKATYGIQLSLPIKGGLPLVATPRRKIA